MNILLLTLSAKFIVLMSGQSFVFDSIMTGIYSSGISREKCAVFNINRNIDSGAVILEKEVKDSNDIMVIMGREAFEAYKKFKQKTKSKNYGVVLLAMNRKLRREVVSSPELVGFDLMVDFTEKIKLIKKAIPSIKKVVYFYTTQTGGDIDLLVKEAQKIGVSVITMEVNNEKELESSIKALKPLGVKFILYSLDPLFLKTQNYLKMVQLATKYKIPVWGETRKYVALGGLMGAEVSFSQLGEIVGDILSLLESKEVYPGLFSTIQGSKYYLFFNRETIKKLGIKIPEELLKKAEKIYPVKGGR